MTLVICIVIVGFALASAAVCWEESRNLPAKAKKRHHKTASIRSA